MKAGETFRTDCYDCEREFEVVYEPKAKNDPKAQKAIPSCAVRHCPFCGSENIEADED